MENAVVAERHQLHVGIPVRLGPVTPQILRFRLDGIEEDRRQLGRYLDVLGLQVFEENAR